MARMAAPSTGVKVRMYRHGHGDCFLLAMRSSNQSNARPVYMLIDCGLKPGSEVKEGQTIDKVIADIAEATDNRLDVVMVTHEHQDHVNGFLKKKPRGGGFCFDPISIGEVWLAWTENGEDDFANSLRERFNDTLIGLVRSEQRLAADGSTDKSETLRELLEFETGGEDAGQPADLLKEMEKARKQNPNLSLREQTALAIDGISNKQAIKYLCDKAERKPPLFLRPDQGSYSIPGVKGAKVYALGPPRDVELLLSLDPTGGEEFHFGKTPLDATRAFRLDGPSRTFFAALEDAAKVSTTGPFSSRHHIPADRVFADISAADADPQRKAMLQHYKDKYGPEDEDAGPFPWRRIDSDWLGDSEALALRLNHEVNNTSLVIAIELSATGKVLLFSGDAQRGSWISWSDLSWSTPGSSSVTARDLLSRTVFYKVGHHGSHNATLDGSADDNYANLAWMGQGDFRSEFVAMIPANTPWARGKKKPWNHPLEAIEKALKTKARGRVFRSDIDQVNKPVDVSSAEWTRFKGNTRETEMFFEYTVFDRSSGPARPTPDSQSDRININTAVASTLQELPCVGSRLAGRIVAFREAHGPFQHERNLTQVPGIGERTFARMETLLTV